MARLRPALVGTAIGMVLVLTGCGGTEPEPPAAPQPPPAEATGPADDAAAGTSAPTQPPEKPAKPAVPEKLKFTAKTVDGKDFSGASLAGKPAVLWFWASWCPNCQAEAPTIAQAAKESAGVRFVGVASQSGVPDMQGFVKQYDLGSFPHIADESGEVWKRFGVTYQPAYAFVTSSGDIELETDNLEDQELLDRVAALR